MLFDIANLTYWIFLAIGIVFFLTVIISGAEDQDFDTDADMDFDIDADIEMEMDSDFDGDNEMPTDLEIDNNNYFSFWLFLSWLGFGKSPLFILLAIDFSTWGVTGWFLNVMIGGINNKIPTGITAVIIFIISFIFALWVGKVLSQPIGQIFQDVGEEVVGERLIGCIGQVVSKKVPYIIEGRIAQADVIDNARNLVTVSVCLPEWATVTPLRGEAILIIEQRKNFYLVIAKDTSDEDKWMNQLN